MIRITSKVEGFRRCGIAHSKAANDYADDRFSKAERKELSAEPMLVVEVIEDDGKKDKKDKKDKE